MFPCLKYYLKTLCNHSFFVTKVFEMNTIETIINQSEKTAVVRLYGVIGAEVDGNQLAHHIIDLGDNKEIEIIQLHINSAGGSVFDGMSVVSAIRTTKAAVHCYIDGIAASMAAVIAVAGNRTFMMDYAKLMIHDPFYAGKTELSPKEKKALDSITDMLQSILSRRGCDKDEIAQLMQEETWFGATDAKKKKLIDEIISSGENKYSNMSAEDLMKAINNEYKPHKSKNMKEIAKALGLPENASEQEILEAIRNKDNENAKWRKDVINKYVEQGVKAGVINDKNKDKMTRLAETDFELFCDLITVESEKKPEENRETSRLSQAIQQLDKHTPQGSSKKTWAWYQEHDPKALEEMEKSNPELFKQLLDEYENQL